MPDDLAPQAGHPMTWLKLDETFDDECAGAGLSSDAYRVHVAGLCHAMRRMTDGYVENRVASRMDVDHPEEALDLLCAVGFWHRVPGGYQIEHHMEHQPTKKEMEDRKAANSARQARARTKKAGDARQKAESELAAARRVTRDTTRDDTRDRQSVTSERSGADLNGTGRNGALEVKGLAVVQQNPKGW